jgi:hypothetical protein
MYSAFGSVMLTEIFLANIHMPNQRERRRSSRLVLRARETLENIGLYLNRKIPL